MIPRLYRFPVTWPSTSRNVQWFFSLSFSSIFFPSWGGNPTARLDTPPPPPPPIRRQNRKCVRRPRCRTTRWQRQGQLCGYLAVLDQRLRCGGRGGCCHGGGGGPDRLVGPGGPMSLPQPSAQSTYGARTVNVIWRS